MKFQQVLMILLIFAGAITGSTLATVNYLYRKDSASITQYPLLQSTDRSSVENSASEPQITLHSKHTSDFSQFRQRLLEAVKRKNGNFVRALVTPQTKWSWGSILNLNTSRIDDPQSPFWQNMEKAVAAGCTVEPNADVPEKEPGSDVWVCPDTAAKPIYNFGWREQVAILGARVNLRAEPSTKSAIVGVVSSKELLQFDSETFTNSSLQIQESVSSFEGWTPVILNDGKRGWVQNNFVYYESRDFRASFVFSRGQWRLRYFMRGDGS